MFPFAIRSGGENPREQEQGLLSQQERIFLLTPSLLYL